MFKTDKKYYSEIKSATCLLLSIGISDEKLDNGEIKIIKEIICDFFSIKSNNYDKIYNECLENLNDSTDIYKFSKVLNKTFSYDDKLDFIRCVFEVAYIDGKLHYLEEFFIKKIATTLNINHKDLINCKLQIKLNLK